MERQNRTKLILVALLSTLLGACHDVDPGYVGVLVIKTGSNRGVQTQPRYGRVWVGYAEDLVKFPVTLQNTVWTKYTTEGSPTDESITFSVRGGVTVNADVGLTFRVDPLRAAALYTRYHQTDLSVLADGEVRNITRDCLSRESANMAVEDILGSGRNDLLNRSLHCIQERLHPHGMVVETLSFTSAPRIPENVQQAINRSLEAQQRLAQAEAQARAEVAQAEGRARAQRAAAQGEADALLIRTRADVENRRLMAEAYRGMSESLTPNVLRYLTLQRWDGTLPTHTLGSQPPSLVTTITQ